MAVWPSSKNQKIAVSQQQISQFSQNLARWCISALQTLLANKILRFLKFKMATATILKSQKIAKFCDEQTNFDKIWHGDVPQSSRPPQQIKFGTFKNSAW